MKYEREYTDMNENWANQNKLATYISKYIKKYDYVTAQKDKKINTERLSRYTDTEMFEIYEDDGSNEYNMIFIIMQDTFHSFIGVNREMADMIREIQKGLFY